MRDKRILCGDGDDCFDGDENYFERVMFRKFKCEHITIIKMEEFS